MLARALQEKDHRTGSGSGSRSPRLLSPPDGAGSPRTTGSPRTADAGAGGRSEEQGIPRSPSGNVLVAGPLATGLLDITKSNSGSLDYLKHGRSASPSGRRSARSIASGAILAEPAAMGGNGSMSPRNPAALRRGRRSSSHRNFFEKGLSQGNPVATVTAATPTGSVSSGEDESIANGDGTVSPARAMPGRAVSDPNMNAGNAEEEPVPSDAADAEGELMVAASFTGSNFVLSPRNGSDHPRASARSPSPSPRSTSGESASSPRGGGGGAAFQWRKGNVLGSGANSVVYMGLQLKSGTLMAVKEVVIAQKNADDLMRLTREVALLSKLSHTHIVKYLGINMTQKPDCDVIHIFMEYVPGGSLEALIRRFGKFPEDLAAVYTSQILSGLAYLHDKEIMHRDIKCANILVTTEGVVKLADFGASKELSPRFGGGDATVTGTPLFMAPEVVLGKTYGMPADIYSVGATVVQMLSGKPPNGHISSFIALVRFWESGAEAVIPSDSMSDEAADFVRDALAYEPDARPTCADLLRLPFLLNGSDALAPTSAGSAGSDVGGVVVADVEDKDALIASTQWSPVQTAQVAPDMAPPPPQRRARSLARHRSHTGSSELVGPANATYAFDTRTSRSTSNNSLTPSSDDDDYFDGAYDDDDDVTSESDTGSDAGSNSHKIVERTSTDESFDQADLSFAAAAGEERHFRAGKRAGRRRSRLRSRPPSLSDSDDHHVPAHDASLTIKGGDGSNGSFGSMNRMGRKTSGSRSGFNLTSTFRNTPEPKRSRSIAGVKRSGRVSSLSMGSDVFGAALAQLSEEREDAFTKLTVLVADPTATSMRETCAVVRSVGCKAQGAVTFDQVCKLLEETTAKGADFDVVLISDDFPSLPDQSFVHDMTGIGLALFMDDRETLAEHPTAVGFVSKTRKRIPRALNGLLDSDAFFVRRPVARDALVDIFAELVRGRLAASGRTYHR